MDTSGYVVLPVDAAFADASPQLEFVDEEDSDLIAVLSYTYAGQSIGSTRLLLSESDFQEFDFQKVTGQETDLSDSSEESAQDGTQKAEPRLLKIKPLKIFV